MRTKTIEEMLEELELFRKRERILARIVEQIDQANETLKTTESAEDRKYLRGVISGLKYAHDNVRWLFLGGLNDRNEQIENMIGEINDVKRKWRLEQIERKGRCDALNVVLEEILAPEIEAEKGS